ncbi:uncharacterized protein LOC129741460 [Uranotaenia lowii]|uniref:uncharacterized protein LOC129741460 n=1 Tax=Uranotaenia lowii TaxID=190385 RepID=UPI00247A0E2E|nr:uncharacterized protein LOC129741460 [Uranotaenia lowii]
MKIYLTILVTFVTVSIGSCEVHWKRPNIKTFLDAQGECASYLLIPEEQVQKYVQDSYPDEHRVRNLVRCLLLNINAWNKNNTIKHYVFKNFFKPSEEDSCYEKRTQECLVKTVDSLPADDVNGRAYQSFLCYYRYYGNLIHEEQFIPFDIDIQVKRAKESISVRNTSVETLQQFCKGNILGVHEAELVLSINYVRNGFFEDGGLNLDRLFTQCGKEAILSDHTRQCVETVKSQFCDQPARNYQLFAQCVQANEDLTLPLLEENSPLFLQLKGSSCDSSCGAIAVGPSSIVADGKPSFQRFFRL